MSRTTRAVAGRRSSLLATSLLASSMVASLGGFAINVATPTAEALAASCSGAITGTPLTTTYSCTADSGTLTLAPPNSVSSASGPGVNIANGSGGVTFDQTGTVSGNADGIDSNVNAGTTTLNIGATVTGGATSKGVDANAYGGHDIIANVSSNVSVQGAAGNLSTTVTGTQGLVAVSDTGNITANLGHATGTGIISGYWSDRR